MKNSRPSLTWRSVISVTALSSLIVGGLGLGARVTPAAPTALAPPSAPPSLAAPDTTTKARAVETLGKLPLSFEENRGQTDPTVKFLSRGDGYSLFLTPSEAVIALRPQVASRQYSGASREEEKQTAKDKKQKTKRENQSLPPHPQPLVLRMQLLGANPATQVTGQELLPGTSNYFVGNDPSKWRKDVPTYAKVQYDDVYPGIDLIYYGNQQQLEYDFIVAPGADPKAIRLDFAGADKVEVDTQGDLVLHTIVGQIRQQKPFVYQEVNGVKQPVPGGYVLQTSSSSSLSPQSSALSPPQVGFEVATYDTSKPLVIDPVLLYSTYLGGGADDIVGDIAVDTARNIYVAGVTESLDFPIANAFQPTPGGPGKDVFVAKLNAAGSALIYSTYLGGFSSEESADLAVDPAGNAFVTGLTTSANFPLMNALQGLGGGSDVFVTQLTPAGGLAYSTYLGGSRGDQGTSIAVDVGGIVYVTGSTASSNFPTRSPLQPVLNGSSDAFMTKLNTTASGIASLVYSTYLGGGDRDLSFGITVDADGNAYLTGQTLSADFPTVNAFQPTAPLGVPFFANAFVTKVNPTGSGLVYSTYLGGSRSDSALGITVDAAGDAYVAGTTDSGDFPTTPGAFQSSYGGGSTDFDRGDGFVTRLSTTGSVVYSTYLGGNNLDGCSDITVDTNGNVYVTGDTFSVNFPFVNALPQPPTCSPSTAGAFVTKLNPAGSAPLYSTPLGTKANDNGVAIVVDSAGNVYVAGVAGVGFTTTAGAFQSTNAGRLDTFVVKIADSGVASLSDASLSSADVQVPAAGGGGLALSFSTFLGGASTDEGRAIALDAAGNIYVTGKTLSDNFPTTAGVAQLACAGGDDVFITKLSVDGSLLYSTYLGGGSDDAGNGITTDSVGNIYLTGETESDDFPTTPGAFQTTCDCFDNDVFVTKLNATGNALVYSTFLGGDGDDDGNAIVVDAAGNAYVTGDVQQNFPTTPGAFDTTFSGGKDASVTKLNADGTALLYSTYLGGGGLDTGFEISVDAAGSAYITGSASSGFPTTPGVVQPAFGGGNVDAFVTKLTTDGTALVYSTYLGGSSSDTGSGLAVDSVGNTYVTGDTASSNFPIVNALQPTFGGIKDAFVTKLSAAGDALVYSTYLGGSDEEEGFGLTVDASGNAYVTGDTSSINFPIASAVQSTFAGGSCSIGDGFVTQLNAAGDTLVYSTYLGGPNNEFGLAISVDTNGNAFVTGNTQAGFPTTAGALQATNGGGNDAFITKLSFTGGGVTPMADLLVTKSDAPDPVTVGSNLTYTLTVTNNGPNDATGVMLTDTLPTSVTFGSVTPSQGSCNKIDAVTCFLGTLASGANATVSLVVTPTTAGSITNTASVSGNETDPTPANNTASANTTVTTAPPPPPANGPDLTGAWLSLTQPCKTVRGVQKCTVKGSLSVQNVGNQTASKSQLQIRLSTDNRFDASDALLKSISVGALKPGQKQKKTVTITLPTGSSASGQFALAVVDAANAVTETNETNNVMVFGPLP